MPRNYKREYKLFHSKPAEKKKRAGRNRARAQVKKRLGAAAVKGKDVDHKNMQATDNSTKNLRVQSKKKNRANNRGKGGRPKGS